VSTALAFEQGQPSLEAIDIVAQLVDARDEFIGFRPARSIAPFFLEIFRNILCKRIGGSSSEA
jgi:hypothetical protein